MMEKMSFLTALMISALGSTIAMFIAFYVLWPKITCFFERIIRRDDHKGLRKEQLSLSFMAYERLLMLVHRMAPKEVMLRNHNSNLSISEFKDVLIADIEAEYLHNFTQQLYVSDAAWTMVEDLKNNTIQLIRKAAIEVNPQGTVDEFVEILLKYVNNLDVNPYRAAEIILKKELSA